MATKRKKIVWYARGGGIAKAGPYKSQIAAVNAMRLASSEPQDVDSVIHRLLYNNMVEGRPKLGLASQDIHPSGRHKEFPDDIFIWPEEL